VAERVGHFPTRFCISQRINDLAIKPQWLRELHSFGSLLSSSASCHLSPIFPTQMALEMEHPKPVSVAPLRPANVTRECHLDPSRFRLRCFARNLSRRSSDGGEKSSLDDSATIPRNTVELNWRAVWDDFRNWLGERLEPVVKTLLRVRTRQLLPLRVESLPKQPVSIDLLDRAFDRRAAPRGRRCYPIVDWVAACLIAPVSRTRLRSSGRAQTCSRARCWTARRRRCRCRAASSATSPSRPPARR